MCYTYLCVTVRNNVYVTMASLILIDDAELYMKCNLAMQDRD